MKKKSAWDRFEKKIDEQQGGCWLWKGAKDGSGYGKFMGHSKVMLPHRFAYEETFGVKLTRNQVIRHTCDEPLCVNPKHLITGTQSDNAKDRWKRTGKTIDPASSISRAISKALPKATSSEIQAALRALGL